MGHGLMGWVVISVEIAFLLDSTKWADIYTSIKFSWISQEIKEFFFSSNFDGYGDLIALQQLDFNMVPCSLTRQ